MTQTTDIDLNSLLYANIMHKDCLGEHNGTISEIRINDAGIKVYALFFGQNIWLDLQDLNKTWWIE